MMGRRLHREALDALLAEPAVSRVLAVLKADTEETRIVGGCVRDALLGRRIFSDIDLATTHLPDEVMCRAAAASLRAVPTGIEHGTVTILVDGHALEVTTLREDIKTDGRHAVVRFGRDFIRDAERRDFTINALSLDEAGRLHDTTEGVRDLQAGRVRFIGDAATRIREDALRILRFFRFHARYGIGAPDREGLDACIAAAERLDTLSRERVRSELLKLLDAPGAVSVIAIMSRAGLLTRIIGNDGYLDRLERVIAAAATNAPKRRPLARSASYDAVARLAALAVESAEDATRLRTTLRLSNDEHVQLSAFAAARDEVDRLTGIDEVDLRRLAATLHLRALTLAIDAMGDREISQDARSYLERLRTGEQTPPVFPLAGSDLVAAGTMPGRLIGIGLSAARTLWLRQGCPEGSSVRATLLAHALDVVGSKA